jgi:hypothetical protein
MKKRIHTMNATASAHAADRTPTTLLYILLTIACAAFLAAGFFFAARQHFAAMDLGMKNSKLRKQIDEMEAQNRQLVLAREIGRSPAEVKRIASNKGFREKNSVLASAVSSPSDTEKLIQKTSSVTSTSDRKPVKAFMATVKQQPSAKFETKTKPAKRPSIDSTAMAISKIR